MFDVAGNRADLGEVARWRAQAAFVAIVAGVFVLGLLTWVIVYEPSHRPWILNHLYPLFPFDLVQRYWQIETTRLGNNIYVPFGANGFSYPPGAILLFLPITYMPFLESFAVWTQLSLWCLAATYLVALRATTRRPWLEHIAIAIWACVATVLLFAPMDYMLSWGQTSTILLLLVALDVLVVRDRVQGVLVGVATAFKLYPGVVIIFWLWRRQWRPAITAVLTFVVVTAVAWEVWPQSSPWYYFKLLFVGGGVSADEISGYNIHNSSVTGFFLRLPFLSHSGAVALGTVASVATAIFGVWVAVQLDRKGYRVSTLVILVCTSVMISPVAWDHYFTFAPLLVFVVMEIGFSTFAGRLAALSLACFTFPWLAYRVGYVHPDLGDDVIDLLGRNALFVAAVLVMVSGLLAARGPRRVATAGAGSEPGMLLPSSSLVHH
jgi:hypothetical protein